MRSAKDYFIEEVQFSSKENDQYFGEYLNQLIDECELFKDDYEPSGE
jgi:hypothetical protein